MEKSERIERRPEYDAEDWEAVGKLKEYVEGIGFTFAENENRLSDADCGIWWHSSYASAVSFRKTIPDIVELLENLKHLTEVSIWSTVDDLRWLCELRDIELLDFWNFDNKIHIDKFRGLDSWISAETIQAVSFFRGLPYIPTFIRKFGKLKGLAFLANPTPIFLPDWIAELPIYSASIACNPCG